MRRKGLVKYIIAVIVITVVSLFVLLIWTFKLSSEDITMVTVQYQTKLVTIEDKDKIKEFCDQFSNAKFTLKGMNTGKGWMYWVRCYDSKGNIRYSFTTLTTNTIDSNSLLYKAKDSNFNASFIDEFFQSK